MGNKTKKYCSDIEATLKALESGFQPIQGQINIVKGLSVDLAKAMAKGSTEDPLTESTRKEWQDAYDNLTKSVSALRGHYVKWQKAIVDANSVEATVTMFVTQKEKKKKIFRRSLPGLVKLEKALVAAIDLNESAINQVDKQCKADGYW